MQEFPETIAAHVAPAEGFEPLFGPCLRPDDQVHVDAFRGALRGRLVLEIGSGGGARASAFASLGYRVVRVDTSAGAGPPARRRHLHTVRGDARTFAWVVLFHGIWANACLPDLDKPDVPGTLERLDRHLMPDGVFSCSVKEGGGPAAFSDAGFRALFPSRYELLRFERTLCSDRTVFLNYLFRKGVA